MCSNCNFTCQNTWEVRFKKKIKIEFVYFTKLNLFKEILNPIELKDLIGMFVLPHLFIKIYLIYHFPCISDGFSNPVP